MSLFSSIDLFIGRKMYPSLVKVDLKSYRKAGFTGVDTLSRIIYNNREKDWKKYQVSLKDIEKIVSEELRIKPISGLKQVFLLMKAKATIREAVKQDRLKFINEDRIHYTDKIGVDYSGSFVKIAGIFNEKVGVGFEEKLIVGILQEEYRKWLRTMSS